MSNNEGITVTLFDSHVRVPNGMGANKNISLTDFVAELQRVATGGDQQREPLRAFRLPNEALSIKVNRNELHILMYFPERIHDLQYIPNRSRDGRGTYSCPIPPTVIFCKLQHNSSNNKWTLEQVKWFCTDYKEDEVPSLEDWGTNPQNHRNHLWPLPFPNQYGDGNMCVGANSYRTLYEPDLRGLNELYHHVLLASPFNDDLGTRTKDGWEPVRLFRFLKDKPAFPFEILPGHPGTINRAEAEAADEAGDEDEGDNDNDDWDGEEE